jgi:cysteine synthase
MSISNKTVWDSIGQTPLLKLSKLSLETGCEIYAKAEFLNPSGSIKDRAAKGIIQNAEKSGLLKAGGYLVEGTAGNTGIGLAMLAAERGYRCIITMPNNQAQQKYDYLKALGAEVHALSPVPFKDENHFYHAARKIAESLPEAVWANQFENTANSDFHFETTGPEIWSQTQGEITDLVAASGTGGTIGGVSAFLKKQNPDVRVTLVDPMGSGLFSYVKTGEIKSEGSSITEGIGIMRVTANFARAQIDDAVQVTDQEMIDMLFRLARQEGLFVGTSAALNVCAAYKLALAHQNTGRKIVTFLCDHGLRYAEKILNKTWLESLGLKAPTLF